MYFRGFLVHGNTEKPQLASFFKHVLKIMTSWQRNMNKVELYCNNSIASWEEERPPAVGPGLPGDTPSKLTAKRSIRTTRLARYNLSFLWFACHPMRLLWEHSRIWVAWPSRLKWTSAPASFQRTTPVIALRALSRPATALLRAVHTRSKPLLGLPALRLSPSLTPATSVPWRKQPGRRFLPPSVQIR